MEPLDPHHPCEFRITYETLTELREAFFTVDTEVGRVIGCAHN